MCFFSLLSWSICLLLTCIKQIDANLIKGLIIRYIHTFTTGGFFKFWGQEGYFELEIQRHGGILMNRIPRAWGVSRGGQTRVWMKERTDNSWWPRKAGYKTSINQSHMCLLRSFTKENRYNLGGTLGFRDLKVYEFLVRLIICDKHRPANWPAMFAHYTPVVYIHKETTVMASDWVNVVRNIEGNLGRICPCMF